MKALVACGALLVATMLSGCCRMCCWQHGGSWSGGSCFTPQPVGAPLTQPSVVLPPTSQPVLLPQQGAALPLERTIVPTSYTQPIYVPANTCTCQ